MTAYSVCCAWTPAGSTYDAESGGRPARERPRLRLSLILGLCAVVLVGLTGGCSPKTPSRQGHAPKSVQPAVPSQRLTEAKAAAASTLADVEVCESAVIAGASLADLSKKALHARDSVQAFSRSENGRLLPKVTAAIALAEQDYLDSCAVWRADENAARASKAKNPLVELDKLRHPNRYGDLWVKAGLDLGAARTALQEATL